MVEHKTFLCANKFCMYMSHRPIERSAEELDGYHLCKTCHEKGYRLKRGVVVVHENKN